MGNEQGSPAAVDALNSREVKSVDWELKHKLSRGTNYNMKVVIRGDRNTGKTQLWRRLQGLGFTASYTPTAEIQVATINWNYKTTDDVVKVEVWDVVDKGRKKKTRDGLKLSNTPEAEGDEDEEEEEEDEGGDAAQPMSPPTAAQAPGTVPGIPQQPAAKFAVADATTVNVMRGTDGVVFVFDVTKRWTWEYIERELPKLPPTLNALVVANFRDMAANRVVSEAEAEAFCQTCREHVTYVEASMKNAYGLRAAAAFFNLPFLALQRRAMQAQLQRNEEDARMVTEELALLKHEIDYDSYVRQLAVDKKSKKEAAAAAAAAAATAAALQSPLHSPRARQREKETSAQSQQPPAQEQPQQPQEPRPEAPAAAVAAAVAAPPVVAEQVPASKAEPQETQAAPGPQEGSAEPSRAAQLFAFGKAMVGLDKKASVVAEAPRAAAVAEQKKPETAKPEQRAEAIKAETPKAEKKPEEPKPAAKKPEPKKPESKKQKKEETKSTIEELKRMASNKAKPVSDVDSFVPGEVDDGFWGEAADDDGWMVPAKASSHHHDSGDEKDADAAADDDDDDDEGGNPLVMADVEEDMEPDFGSLPKKR
eukprot:m51a1_g10490 putative rab-like protein 6 (593) ;mRNA; r:68049-70302